MADHRNRPYPAYLIELAQELSESLSDCRFGPPVERVYRPLEYAWQAHREYLRRFGGGERRVLIPIGERDADRAEDGDRESPCEEMVPVVHWSSRW